MGTRTGAWIEHEIKVGERAITELLDDVKKLGEHLEQALTGGTGSATVKVNPASGHVVVRTEHEDSQPAAAEPQGPST